MTAANVTFSLSRLYMNWFAVPGETPYSEPSSYECPYTSSYPASIEKWKREKSQVRSRPWPKHYNVISMTATILIVHVPSNSSSAFNARTFRWRDIIFYEPDPHYRDFPTVFTYGTSAWTQSSNDKISPVARGDFEIAICGWSFVQPKTTLPLHVVESKQTEDIWTKEHI